MPFLVSGAEAVRDRERDLDRLARLNRAFVQAVAQRLALQQLGDEVRRALRVADVVDRQEVGMIEHPGRARFLLEPHEPLAIAERDVRQNLDGDVPSEPRVLARDRRRPCRLRRSCRRSDKDQASCFQGTTGMSHLNKVLVQVLGACGAVPAARRTSGSGGPSATLAASGT